MRLTRLGDIDRVVFHHRSGDAILARKFGVGELLGGVDGGRAEIMLKAQGVTDLVHHRILQVFEHECLRLGTVGINVTACFEQIHRESAFLRRVFGNGTKTIFVVAGKMRGGSPDFLDTEIAAIAQSHYVHPDVGIQNFAGPRIPLTGPDRAERRPSSRHPGDRRTARIKAFPIGVIGLNLYLHSILETDALEGLVPFENAFGDRGAILFGNAAIQPKDDRFFWL